MCVWGGAVCVLGRAQFSVMTGMGVNRHVQDIKTLWKQRCKIQFLLHEEISKHLCLYLYCMTYIKKIFPFFLSHYFELYFYSQDRVFRAPT